MNHLAVVFTKLRSISFPPQSISSLSCKNEYLTMERYGCECIDLVHNLQHGQMLPMEVDCCRNKHVYGEYNVNCSNWSNGMDDK